MESYAVNNFHTLDNKKYIIRNNQEFLIWYNQVLTAGYKSIFSIIDFQNLIDQIVAFFEFKEHDKLLEDIIFDNTENDAFHKSMEYSKKLDIEELKYRLQSKQIKLLECKYPPYFWVTKPKEEYWEITSIFIKILNDGQVNQYNLESLKENNYLSNIEGITTPEDLLARLKVSNPKIDYQELDNIVFQHNIKVSLRNKLLELVPLALIYSPNTLPQYGYIRAKNFINTFNKEYNLNLSTNEIDEIMKFDYSKINSSNKESTKSLIKKLTKKFNVLKKH